MSPDPLFRNSLENYRKAAPTSVWDRVEAGLERKRRKAIWFKIAAGLFLLLATSVSLIQFNQTDSIVDAVSTNTSAPTMKPVETLAGSHQPSAISYQSSTSIDPIPNQINPIVERSRNEPLKSSQQSAESSQQSAVSSKHLAVGSQKTSNRSVEEQSITFIEPEEINAEFSSINSIAGSGSDVLVEQKGTSITYTADLVNTRFIKKDLPTKATPEKKNTSGLQKVIDKALDLTHEGTVYGELREKKNEWLSFNMMSNKTEANK